MPKPLSIFELLNDTQKRYVIPLYQRNFAWTGFEISQLVIDVLDSIKERRKDYFIGTLVICKNGEEEYDIIDGQQRYTAILLIALVIQNEYKNQEKIIEKLNLSFRARQQSNEALVKFLANNTAAIEENELLDGYKNTVDALNEYVGKNDYSCITINKFKDYLLKNVKIFINEMPAETDVNLYFERFNSRGEQLEYHEIIKAELMQRLLADGCDTATIQKFAKIWDVCSEFETPCIKFFKKKRKHADADEERERIFKCSWVEYSPGNNSWRYGYNLQDVYSKVVVNNENKATLISVLGTTNTNTVTDDLQETEIEESNRYRCIINYNTFLYYVLYITDKISVDDAQFDDKKLKASFRIPNRDKKWILNFGVDLLKAKFIFDSFIIRSSLETTTRRKEGEWFLQKAYREDKNEKTRGHLYVQTRFDKNSFGGSYNDNIIMLQSMFAVTFTAYKDTKWLFSTLKFLFDNAENLNNELFGGEFCNWLEQLSKQFAKERICENGSVVADKLRYDNGVSVFAFNLMDYVLWKHRSKLRDKYLSIKFEEFRFAYRRSIEHWYPQNPNKEEGNIRLADDLLHSFGNLCLIVASQNSAFGRLYPLAKLANWRSIFHTQSLKLQMMARWTDTWQCWDETKRVEILNWEDDMLELLNDYIRGNA
jgi:hypothetical protein